MRIFIWRNSGYFSLCNSLQKRLGLGGANEGDRVEVCSVVVGVSHIIKTFLNVLILIRL